MSDEHDDPSAPRPDAAEPAWYPHPRRPGALRYWNGLAWVEAEATQGWYPDPADRHALRFWTGRTWGEVLEDDPWAQPAPPPAPVPAPVQAPVPAPEPTSPAVAPIPAVEPNPRLADAPGTPSTTWVTSVLAVACLVAGTVVGGVAVSTFLGGDEPSAEPRATTTVTTTPTATPGATTGAGAVPPADEDLRIVRVLSSRTLELRGEAGKVEVRLLGLGTTPCDTNAPGKTLLKEEVRDRVAVISTLTDPETGDVGAYVDVEGQDVGELLIRAGLATAAVGHPRAPAYARAAGAATPYCTPTGAPSPSPTTTTAP